MDLRAVGVTLSLCMHLAANTPVDDLQRLAIPLGKPSPQVAQTRAALAAHLKGVNPARKAAPQTRLTHEGQSILCGDLFKTGDFYAVFEVSNPSPEGPPGIAIHVAFAEWSEGNWVLRGLWNITPIWRPAGWKQTHHDPLPVTPATQPFHLRDLSGDGVAELIIAGEVDKFFKSITCSASNLRAEVSRW
jgi:hypothetical protein